MSGSIKVRSSFISSLQQIPASSVGLAHFEANGVATPDVWTSILDDTGEPVGSPRRRGVDAGLGVRLLDDMKVRT
jgi:hypothetical protein